MLTLNVDQRIEIYDYENSNDRVIIDLFDAWKGVLTSKHMSDSQKKRFPPDTNLEAVLGFPSPGFFSSMIWILFFNPEEYKYYFSY